MKPIMQTVFIILQLNGRNVMSKTTYSCFCLLDMPHNQHLAAAAALSYCCPLLCALPLILFKPIALPSRPPSSSVISCSPARGQFPQKMAWTCCILFLLALHNKHTHVFHAAMTRASSVPSDSSHDISTDLAGLCF